MSDNKDRNYEIPSTYEEAVLRKQELLEKINEYNEAFFNETDLPYTEEEIEELQEEYQILNDHLQLTDKEKIARLDEKDKETLDDGTVVKVDNFFDKIHPFTYVYIFLISLLIILFCPILSYTISNSIFNNQINAYYETIINQTGSGLALFNDPSLIMSEGTYWFKIIFSLCLVPLIVLVVSTIFFVVSRFTMNSFNKKIFLIVFLAHVVIFIVSLILIFFIKIYKDAQEYYDNIVYYYYLYAYQNYGMSS